MRASCLISLVLVVMTSIASARGPASPSAPIPANDAAAGSASALIEKARAHHRAGQALFEAGDYQHALSEFQAGYDLVPRPEFLLNLGQVHRLLHDPRAAIAMFEKFLASVSSNDPRRAAVADVILELRAESSDSPTTPPAPAPATAATPLLVARPRHRWYRDWVGGTLTGVGVVSVAAGAGLFAQANTVVGDASIDLEHYDRAKDATVRRTAGLVVLGVGGALVLGGVLRYALHR